MREGLLFVHDTLVGAGLRDRIRIGVAGKIVSAFDIASEFGDTFDTLHIRRMFSRGGWRDPILFEDSDQIVDILDLLVEQTREAK